MAGFALWFPAIWFPRGWTGETGRWQWPLFHLYLYCVSVLVFGFLEVGQGILTVTEMCLFSAFLSSGWLEFAFLGKVLQRTCPKIGWWYFQRRVPTTKYVNPMGTTLWAKGRAFNWIEVGESEFEFDFTISRVWVHCTANCKLHILSLKALTLSIFI